MTRKCSKKINKYSNIEFDEEDSEEYIKEEFDEYSLNNEEN